MTFLERFRSWFGVPAKPRKEPAAWVPDSGRPDLFDPALAHYSRGFRKGDPALPQELLESWHAVHDRAIRDVAVAIAQSPAAEHVVLRGGYALRLWFGASSRRARDLDFVVATREWDASGQPAITLLERITLAVNGIASTEFAFVPEATTLDDIWTYDRVEGRRLTFRYQPARPDLHVHWGHVQVDVVFGEPLGDPVTRTALDAHSGAALNVASPRESLAWKLYWLWSDIHCQGKDLYDAVLLAERAEPGSLVGLTGLLMLADSVGQCPIIKGPVVLPALLADLRRLDLRGEWGVFEREYPDLAAPGVEVLLSRLLVALERGTVV